MPMLLKMLRNFLSILALCFSTALMAQDTKLANRLKGLVGGERIIALRMHFDTVGTAKKNVLYIDRLLQQIEIQLANSNDAEFEEYTAYLRTTKETIFSTDAAKRLKIFQHALKHFEKLNQPIYIAMCTHYIGQNYFVMEKYGAAFEHILSSNHKFREIGFEKVPLIGKILHDQALNYYFFRDYKEVVTLMEQAMGLPIYSPNLDIQRYNNMALAYRGLNEMDKSIFYLRKTIERANFYRDSVWVGLAAGNLAKVYKQKGELHEALRLYQTNYEHNKNNHADPKIIKGVLLQMAKVNLLLNRWAEALACLKKSEKIKLEANGLGFGDLQYHENLKSLYFEVCHLVALKKADYKTAYVYLDSMKTLGLNKTEKYNAIYIKQEQVKLDIQKYLVQAKLKAKEQELFTTRLLIVGISAFLLMVIFALLYYVARIKRSKEKALGQYRESVLEKEKAVATEELIQAKNDLESSVLRINLKNEQIAKIREELSELNKAVDSVHKSASISHAKDRLQTARLLTNKDWREFKLNFSDLHHEFLTNLKLRYPALTASETRYLMLSRLDLDYKEMAGMLGVSVESIRVTSHRLRKKTGMATEDLLKELST